MNPVRKVKNLQVREPSLRWCEWHISCPIVTR